MKKLIALILCCFALCFALVLFLGHGKAGQPDITGPEQPEETRPVPTAEALSGGQPDATAAPDATVSPADPDATAPTQAENWDGEGAALDVTQMSRYLFPVNQFAVFNEEMQVYLDSQSAIQGSRVTLTADKLDEHYLSGKVESNISFLYGDFTFRIRTLRGSGLFPAIWMLPETNAVLPEVDIYESIGSQPTDVHGVLHYKENGIQDRYYYYTTLPADIQQFTVGLHWDESSLVWYVDGVPIHTVTDHIPAEHMYLIMNLAVGGSWAQPPTPDTPFPSSFQVDVLEFRPRNVRSR